MELDAAAAAAGKDQNKNKAERKQSRKHFLNRGERFVCCPDRRMPVNKIAFGRNICRSQLDKRRFNERILSLREVDEICGAD
jgi:hypothetical protein